MGNMAPDQTENFDVFFRVLRRRWRMLVLSVVLVTAAAVGFSELQQKEYTASSALLFSNTQFDQALFGANFNPGVTDPTREAATNVDLVSLSTVSTRTASVLHLRAGLVTSEVSVAGIGQANIVQVSVTDPNPKRAALIANTYAQQYTLFRREADRSQISGAQTLVRNELAGLSPRQRNSSVGVTLQNRANQLGVLAALQTGNAQVAQLATVPRSPSSPKTTRNAVLGFLIGLLLGMGLIFIAERLDRRIRDASELEETYGVPLLGVIPESDAYERSGRDPLPAAEGEAFALLRARLRYFNVDRDVRTLLLSSTIPGEGKTTVALNLAMAEAVAGNTRVVLVEADLRRPVLAQRLGIQAGPGLAEILSRNANFEAVQRRVPILRHVDDNGDSPFVTVITAGAIPPNAAELVESRAMIDLLSSLSERFDLVIIDSPPTSVVSDAIPLMRLVSGVILVSRIGTTTRDAARHLREQLGKLNAPTLGVVANATPIRDTGYYSSYGYYRQSDAEPQSDATAQTDTPVVSREPASEDNSPAAVEERR